MTVLPCPDCQEPLGGRYKWNGAEYCSPCFDRRAEGVNRGDNTELGTRSTSKELGTRRTSTPLNGKKFLVRNRPELGSTTTPSSDVASLKLLILEDVRMLRAERRKRPPKAGDPDVVPYALSLPVKNCGARDKSEARRAINSLLKAGDLKFEYELAPRGKAYGTRCYSLPEGTAA